MITAALIGALVGFVLAMPPGPIGMAAINISLDKGTKPGIKMAVGTAGLDMIYSMIAIFAASAVEKAVGSFFDENPIVFLAFQLVVVLGLIFAGALYLRKKKKFTEVIDGKEEVKLSKFDAFIEDLKTKGPFLVGIALALTNIANPTFLPSLAVTAAWIHKLDLFANAFGQNMLFAVGFGVGNFIWLYLLMKTILRFKHKFSSNTLVRIKQFAGITFIGFGGLIGYRVVMFTKWPEIFRLVFAI
jgi:threonine/homoserine/homoserine lactone efflux protein